MKSDLLPSLLTITDLINYLNDSQERSLSEEAVMQHGLDGALSFVVVDPAGEPLKLTPAFTNPNDPRPQLPPSFESVQSIPITHSILVEILKGKKIRITFTHSQGPIGMEQLLSVIPLQFYSKKDLRIKKEEAQRFEQKHFYSEPEIKELAPYLNPNDDLYAEEMAIAAIAHTAIFTNGEGNQAASNSNRVDIWLHRNYPDRSDAFYLRIKTVILPK